MNTILNALSSAAVGDMLKYTGQSSRLFTVGKEYPVIDSDGRLTVEDNMGTAPPPWWDHPRYTFELIKKTETPTVFGGLSRDEKVALMSAKIDGKDIEFFNPVREQWVVLANPSWSISSAYRVFRTAEEIEMDELREKLEVFNKDIIAAQGEKNILNNAGGHDFDCMGREAQGALLLAHHNGERIQFKSEWLSEFITLDAGITPEWDNDTQYRVEPTEVAELTVKIDMLSNERSKVQDRIDELNKPTEMEVTEVTFPSPFDMTTRVTMGTTASDAWV